jgi:DNA processing protein
LTQAIRVTVRLAGAENRRVTSAARPDDPAAWLERLRDPGERDPAGIERDLRWLAGPGRALVAVDDPRYPAQLAAVPGCPPALFVEGDPALLSRPQVAIVGSRAATAAGRETAFEFAARLAAHGFAITSGLAVGIDAAAHRGALAAAGVTIAVCGTGLDRVYPAEHHELAGRIAAAGALVSEFPTGTPPQAYNFPRRNRLISGLARGVLVIEAAARSGSLITARLAGEQGREVMAVPGSIHNPLARGCHRLIKDGAALVETVDDVLAALGLSGLAGCAKPAVEMSNVAENPNDVLDSDAEMLLNALGFEPAHLDRLVERTGLAAQSVISKLQLLELEGRVESLAGGRYSRTSPRQAR